MSSSHPPQQHMRMLVYVCKLIPQFHVHRKRGLGRDLLFYLLIMTLIVPMTVVTAPDTAYAQATILPPTFSTAHGYFSAPIQLILTAEAGLQIRYTVDFSTPTATQGNLYTDPITIDTTTVVRAVAFNTSNEESITVTQSYIFLSQIRNQGNSPGAGWPTHFGTTDQYGGPYPAYYEMAPEIVNHATNTNEIENALLALPAVSLVTDGDNLWDAANGIYVNPNEKGRSWERPLSLEWLDPVDTAAGFTVNAGVRVHGQASRRPHRTPKKSLRLYFRNSDYGVGKLDYKVFPDTNATSKFDRILFRGGGNRSYPYYDNDQRREADYISDEFSRRIFLEMGGLTAHGTFVHLYLNGQYWGLYNLTERIDDKFLVTYFGELETDYDLIKPDEDFGYVPTPDAGTIDAWNELHALVNVDQVSDSAYQQVLERLDVVDLADYMILLHYIANTDWPAHNWLTYRKRVGPDRRFRMIIWDSDTSLNKVNENMTLADAPDTPARLFHKLMTNGEFRQLVADRFYRHLDNSQGLLTPANCAATYSDLANTVDSAIIGESARWGAYARKVYPQIPFNDLNKALPAYFYSRAMPLIDADPTNDVPDNEQKNWLQVRDEKLADYCPQRTDVVIGQYMANGWYTTTVQAPTFSQEGGTVETGYALAIDNSINSGVGTIYYTVDGSDPRAVGGAVASGATDGGDLASVTINEVMTVRARVFDNGLWSPLHEATFYPGQPLSNLVINEIHYHPAAPLNVDGDLFEFIEFYNRGTVPLQLDNLVVSRGFTYVFPANTTIEANAYLVLSPNAAQFQARYGFAPDDMIVGNLSNGGEAIEIQDAQGNVIDFVDYDDIAPWPTTPDGNGPSLSLIDPTLDNASASSWGASATENGTPGQPNTIAAANQPPVITITSPTNGATFEAGGSVMITANASDSDGTVQEVAFYADDTLLCTVTTAPYQCSFTPSVGTQNLTARATDNSAAVTISAGVTITVNAAAQPPTASITNPTANATFAQGETVTIEATASDSDGTIQQVEFLVDNAVACTVTTMPYRCDVTPAPGSHLLTARATDSQGLVTTSAPVAITITTPEQITVVLGQPNDGSEIPLDTEVLIVANVTGDDVQRVEILSNGAVLCTIASAPYRCSWTPETSGQYTLLAKAYGVDSEVESTAITVTVADPVPGTSSNVIYLPLLMR